MSRARAHTRALSLSLSVVGGWWLVVSGWWLVVGGWWLVVGGWWLVVPQQTVPQQTMSQQAMPQQTMPPSPPPAPPASDEIAHLQAFAAAQTLAGHVAFRLGGKMVGKVDCTRQATESWCFQKEPSVSCCS